MYAYQVISIIGLGYIGLPTATLFASKGNHVIGVDLNQDVVATVNRGTIHIVEPDLEGLVSSVVQRGLLRAFAEPQAADAFIIAVPTPFKGNHDPDISYIETAGKTFAPHLKKGDLVILESTSPVGTTEELSRLLSQHRPDLSFSHQAGEDADVQLAYCPERVLPGNVIHELVENDRIIGGMTKKATAMATALYQIFVNGKCIPTNARTAEMCKLTENSFRDVNIAFANELSIICDKLDINVWELIELANHHPRVKILKPGPGVGGHCIAVDPWFIVSKTPQEAQLIHTARKVNAGKPHHVLNVVYEKMKQLFKSSATIGCLGLAFKANIDDLRESPAVEIALELAKHPGMRLLAHEPNIKSLPPKLAGKGITLVDQSSLLSTSDIILVLVDHREYFLIDWQSVNKPVIDTRGIVRRDESK